jgi:hypothetical protein
MKIPAEIYLVSENLLETSTNPISKTILRT